MMNRGRAYPTHHPLPTPVSDWSEEQLLEAARQQRVAVIRGQVMADNEPMLGLMEALNFVVNLTDDETVVEVYRRLG